MNDIKQTLAERGKRYGKFLTQACIAQDLKVTMHQSAKWHDLAPDQKECLEMVANKIGRILNGDPFYVDSWHDIEGYVRLIVDRLSSNSTTTNGLTNPAATAVDAPKSGPGDYYLDRFLEIPEPASPLKPMARDWLEEAHQLASAQPSCEGSS